MRRTTSTRTRMCARLRRPGSRSRTSWSPTEPCSTCAGDSLATRRCTRRRGYAGRLTSRPAPPELGDGDGALEGADVDAGAGNVLAERAVQQPCGLGTQLQLTGGNGRLAGDRDGGLGDAGHDQLVSVGERGHERDLA